MGIHNKGRTAQRQRMMLSYYAYGIADQQIRQAIVEKEQRQDVRFDGLVMAGVLVREIIPWYRMPIELRALPFKDRPVALAQWEQQNGDYMAESEKQSMLNKGRGVCRGRWGAGRLVILTNP